MGTFSSSTTTLLVLAALSVAGLPAALAQPSLAKPPAAKTMLEAASPAQTVQRLLNAFAARDVQALVDGSTDTAVLSMPYALEGPKRLEGRAQLTGYFQAVFARYRAISFQDVRLTPAADGKTVFVEAKATYEALDGSQHRMGYVWAVVVEQGRVASSRNYILPAGAPS
jgi:ketosteroid isomerase-like protein